MLCQCFIFFTESHFLETEREEKYELCCLPQVIVGQDPFHFILFYYKTNASTGICLDMPIDDYVVSSFWMRLHLYLLAPTFDRIA